MSIWIHISQRFLRRRDTVAIATQWHLSQPLLTNGTSFCFQGQQTIRLLVTGSCFLLTNVRSSDSVDVIFDQGQTTHFELKESSVAHYPHPVRIFQYGCHSVLLRDWDISLLFLESEFHPKSIKLIYMIGKQTPIPFKKIGAFHLSKFIVYLLVPKRNSHHQE